METLAAVSETSSSSCDVCLVNMPLAGLERPSIALGQLQTLLQKDGVATSSRYANIWFAEYFGLQLVKTLISVPPEDALVDWLFSGAAFPEFSPDHDAYLAMLSRRAPGLAASGLDSQALLDLRSRIPGFVDWAAATIVKQKPRIVGCTSTFQQHVASLALLRRLRVLDPDIVTMIGGANCESVMGRTTHANFSWVDFVVSGEADGFIVKLVGDVLNLGSDLAADALPYGVFAPVHRRVGYPVTDQGDGTPRAVTEDARSLPLPDYDDYFSELRQSLYTNVVEPGLPMEFSRGCWWGAKSHCTFCGLNGGSMAYRAKPAEAVVNEMTELSDRYDIRRIEAVDNIMDMGYFKTVLPDLADRKRPFELFFETKANLKKNQVRMLSEAGVHWIQPGIESLDSRILALMGKGCTAAQNILLLKWCRQFGVRTSWAIITDFPGEEDEWYAEMATRVPALLHLQPGSFIPLRYDRYSPYFNKSEHYGLKLRPSPCYQYAYPLSGDELFNQVYFFEDENQSDEPRSRPGVLAMRSAIERWVIRWKGSSPPVLTMVDTGDELVIEDSRDGETTTTLSGLHREALLAADEGPPEQQVIASLIRDGYDTSCIAAALNSLEEQKLLIRIDGRAIALPLTKPHQRIPLPSAFPGGTVTARPGKIESFFGNP